MAADSHGADTPSRDLFPYAGHDRGVVMTQPRPGKFEERPMTAAELAAREPALKIARDIYRHANQAGACYYEIWDLIAHYIAGAISAASETRPTLDVADVCDGKEQDEFERWAKTTGYGMKQHPIHRLFLDRDTYARRRALAPVKPVASAPCVAAPQFVEAAKRFAKAHIESDRLDRMDPRSPDVADAVYAAAYAEYNAAKSALVSAYKRLDERNGE